MFSKLLEGLRLRSVERQTRRELNQLTDRELADLGLSRSDVERVISGTYLDPQTAPKVAASAHRMAA